MGCRGWGICNLLHSLAGLVGAQGLRVRVLGFRIVVELEGVGVPRKVDISLPGKENSSSHGARPVY